MKKELITTSQEETRRFGQELAVSLSGGSVVALSGDLGAGKTTLTQGLLEALGVSGPYTSPTFVLMKRYDVDSERYRSIRRIYHADAYRIGTQEMLSIGWEEWIEDSEGIVIIEWPERIADIVPETAVNVSLEWLDESRRKITVA
jgi:tRNA threonylcarbamoyladenosine biosynthesis protein TsaE